MSVYVIAQLKFTNKEKYNEYMAKFPGVFKDSGGKIIAADQGAKVLEGEWNFDKIVIMEFEGKEQAQAFLENPAYQEITEIRKQGADATSLYVRGLK